MQDIKTLLWETKIKKRDILLNLFDFDAYEIIFSSPKNFDPSLLSLSMWIYNHIFYFTFGVHLIFFGLSVKYDKCKYIEKKYDTKRFH